MRIQAVIGAVMLVCCLALAGCSGSEGPRPAAASPTRTAGSPAEATTPAGPTDCRYQVTLHSTCTAKMPDGQTNEIGADASIEYTWRFRGNQAELLLHRIEDRTTLGDQPTVCSTRSREQIHARRGDEVIVDATQDTAEEPLAAMLQASFDTPLCTMILDDDGREVARQTTVDPGAKMVLDEGVIANTRLFHGPFPAEKKTWQAPAEISMGGGRLAKGTLEYTVLDRPPADRVTPPEQVAVRVTGQLAGGDDEGPAGRDLVTYRFDGTQVYDRKQGCWISGKFDVGVRSEVSSGNDKIVADGTTRIEMSLVSAGSSAAVNTAARPASGPR